MIRPGYEKYFEKMQKLTCCICGCDFYDYTGHNPWPIVDDAESVCCYSCNERVVIPERQKQH